MDASELILLWTTFWSPFPSAKAVLIRAHFAELNTTLSK